ncbi:4Fe-4S binding protein [bacterium]|nr:4Fe-4S binding protein [bacterium]
MNRFFKEPWDAVLSLVTGLMITLRQMFSKPCTIQYPEERLIWPDRTRGRLVMPRTEAGKHKCTACLMCQRNCPNGSIEIKVKTIAGSNKRELDDYLFHLDRCTFCGICVETCPFDALRMSHEHEIAVQDKARLKLHLQTETIRFNPAWRGALPAKDDTVEAQKPGQSSEERAD